MEILLLHPILWNAIFFYSLISLKFIVFSSFIYPNYILYFENAPIPDTMPIFGGLVWGTMKEKPSEKAKIEFDREIRSAIYNQQYVGVVMTNDKIVIRLYIVSVSGNGNISSSELTVVNWTTANKTTRNITRNLCIAGTFIRATWIITITTTAILK